MISSMYGSRSGNVSTILVLTARWTLLLTFCRPAMSSLATGVELLEHVTVANNFDDE